MRTKVKFVKAVALVFNDFCEYYKNFRNQEINKDTKVDFNNTVVEIAQNHECRFVRINHKDISKRVSELAKIHFKE
jgi:hypothetical protein